jgi:hypothetical protein
MEIGSNIFQPRFITWSYLNLGKVHRTQINKKIMHTTLAMNHRTEMTPPMIPDGQGLGSQGRKLDPPKNKATKTPEPTMI